MLASWRLQLIGFALVAALAACTATFAVLAQSTLVVLFAVATFGAAVVWGVLVQRSLAAVSGERARADGSEGPCLRLDEPCRAPSPAEEPEGSLRGVGSELLGKLCIESRGPLHAIVEAARGLRQATLDEGQCQALNQLLDSAEALHDLASEVLSFLEIGDGRRERAPAAFRLREALGAELRSIARRAQEKALELVVDVAEDVPEAVVGDPDRLGQVVGSLLGSAIRQTEWGEVVLLVRLEPAAGGDLTLRFEISATGSGGPAPTGLGFALSKRLVETMGGRLAVQSEAERGISLHFVLKLGRQADSPLPATGEPQMGGLSVLVVDDNATSRRVLTELLRSWSMKPFAVETGTLGLAALRLAKDRGQPFDLALVDWEMPGMDGPALLEKIRETPELAGVPRVLLAPAPGPEEAARARALGATCLAKPITAPDLRGAIREALSGADPVAAER
jgi:signal transduction histidine kinase/ActR/RegA family two-component response regulator